MSRSSRSSKRRHVDHLDDLDHLDHLGPHAWIILPSESSAASATASERVGCAWTARSISSTVYSFSRATTSSLMIYVACDPMMWAPRFSLYLALRMIFTKPSVSSLVRARPFPEKGNFPTLYSSFFSLHCCSVSPIDATSG